MKTAIHDAEMLEEGWLNVEEFILDARLIAYDGCHKIYLAMDDAEAGWFREHYDFIETGTPTEMLDCVRDWFGDSCGLRFVNAVYRNEADPNKGFVSLIAQFAE